MKFGLNVLISWNQDTIRFLLELIKEAENSGWDGFFLWDHLAFPWPSEVAEPWTVLSAAATFTKNIKMGTIVTPLARHRPQSFARQLTTLDHISEGRVILGAGLGNPYDFEPYGEKSKNKVLAKKLDESLNIISQLWTGTPVTYQGKYYKINGISYQPTPIQKPKIPIWIGGVSIGALKRAARWDGWCPVGPSESAGQRGTSLEEIKESIKKIEEIRGNLKNYDIVYTVDFPTVNFDQNKFLMKCKSVGVTWILDHLYGLRMTEKEALDKVKQGPPQI